MPTFEPAQAELSRRRLLVTTLSSGFALAVQPVSAETITTSAEGLETAEVKIPTGTGELPAFVARPKQGKALPMVLVVHEIFGVHEHIKDVCRRLAKHGYCALAPELYARQGDVSKLSEMGDIRKIVGSVPDAQVMSDLDASVAFAKKSGHVNTAKLGITGFCWGGRIVWLYAAHNPSLKAGVAFYGRLVGDKDELHPKHPVDVASDLKAPVLGLYGAQDQGIPVATVEQMQKALALAKAGSPSKKSEFKLYPDSGHAFFADYRPSYRKADADDAWQRLLDWLKKHGVA